MSELAYWLVVAPIVTVFRGTVLVLAPCRTAQMRRNQSALFILLLVAIAGLASVPISWWTDQAWVLILGPAVGSYLLLLAAHVIAERVEQELANDLADMVNSEAADAKASPAVAGERLPKGSC